MRPDIYRQLLLIIIISGICIFFPKRNFYAQNKFIQSDSLTGTWKGTSICQVKNSPCHDEIAVYHILKTGKENVFQFVMNKIVNGKEEEMGIINYLYDPTLHTFTSTDSAIAIWKFEVNGRLMNGTLFYKNVLYRVIRLKKE